GDSEEAALAPDRRKLLLVAAGLGLLLLLAVFLWPGGGEEPAIEEAPPVSEAPIEPREEAPADPAALTRGHLVVVATPWGEVVGITSADGEDHPLPPGAATPLRLELPEGLYRIELARPGSAPAEDAAQAGEDSSRITAQCLVKRGEVRTCQLTLAEATATALFRESGWWK
ncbi:MAG: hypothetical protein MI919_35020, partial [Holophagales bacterium]|nr:hypothetical protein [Holophagales bacterium]